MCRLASSGTSRCSANRQGDQIIGTSVSPRRGRNGAALPSSVGRRGPSFLDKSRPGDTRQRTPLVLPCRRFRHGTEEGTRAGRAARRRSSQEPQHTDQGVLAARSGRILCHDQCAWGPNKALRPTAATRRLRQNESCVWPRQVSATTLGDRE